MNKLILFFIFSSIIALAQSKSDSLIIYKSNDKYGFTNAEMEVIIPAKFSYIRPFTKNGLAKVQESGKKIGFINKKGKYVIKPQFSLATSFFDDFAFIYKKGQIHRINTKGKIIQSIQKDVQIIEFSNFLISDTILCQQNLKYNWNYEDYRNKTGMITKNGELLISPIFYNIVKDNNNNTLTSKLLKCATNTPDCSEDYTLFSPDYIIIDSTILYLTEDWETGQSAVVSQNKQGDTIINSSPPLINFRTWIRDKKHPFHNNKFLDFKNQSPNKEHPYTKKHIRSINNSNASPFTYYKKLYTYSCDTIDNIFNNDAIIIENDSIYFYPSSDLHLKTHRFQHFVFNFEILHPNGKWFSSFEFQERGRDFLDPFYQQTDNQFGYVCKLPILRGDSKTKIRIGIKTKDENGNISMLKSNAIEMYVPSYLFTDLPDHAIRNYFTY